MENNSDTNSIEGKLIPSLYQQEYGHTYYTVENGKCNCRGLQKLMGYKKTGEPYYREIVCDHIKLANNLTSKEK